MKGVCRKCGCTAERACPGGCEWTDDNEDLCSRCGQELLNGPLDNLGDAVLVARLLRDMMGNVVAELIGLKQQVALLTAMLGGGEIETRARGEIWTPGGEL